MYLDTEVEALYGGDWWEGRIAGFNDTRRGWQVEIEWHNCNAVSAVYVNEVRMNIKHPPDLPMSTRRSATIWYAIFDKRDLYQARDLSKRGDQDDLDKPQDHAQYNHVENITELARTIVKIARDKVECTGFVTFNQFKEYHETVN